MIGVTTVFAAVLMVSIVIPPGGLWGPVPGTGTVARIAAPAALPIEPGPRSTAEMGSVNPSGTLTADELDVAIAASAAEVARSREGEAHVHPGRQSMPPAPAAVVYTCPMHTEVTSSKPGTCPKCGMALVRKGSK